MRAGETADDAILFETPQAAERLGLVSAPTWLFDVDAHRIWWANRSACRFFGAETPAALIADARAGHAEADRLRLRDLLDNTRVGQPSVDIWALESPEGQVKAKLAGTPVRIDADRRLGLLVECLDWNILAGASEKSLRLLEAARNAPQMLRMFSANGDLLMQNTAAAGAYGRLGADGAPARLSESFADFAEAAPILAALTRGEEVEREAPMRTRLGDRWHLVRAWLTTDPVTDDGVIVLSETDIDAEVDARRRMRHWGRELEQQVEERTEELARAERDARAAKAEAERANDVKSNFLASMSHELRTPLNAIIGFSELISMRLSGPLPPDYAEYAGSIHGAARHLLSLIEQLLDLAKIEAGSHELVESDVDLDEQLTSAARMVAGAPYGAGKSFPIEIAPEELMLRCDARALRQVLLNLVSNAAKFSPAGGEIRITAGLTPAWLEIRVSDQGPGIAAEDLERVMLPYQQAPQETRAAKSGTGLGLPIARELMALHDGSLHLESALGEGTVAIARLPRARVIAPTGARGAA